MDDFVMQIVIAVISGVIVEIIAKILIKTVRRSSSKSNSQSKGFGKDVFNLQASKKDVSTAFYLSFVCGLAFILLMVFVDFKKLGEASEFLSWFANLSYFFFTFFSTTFFFNHFLAFHEALARWDDNPKSNLTDNPTDSPADTPSQTSDE